MKISQKQTGLEQPSVGPAKTKKTGSKKSDTFSKSPKKSGWGPLAKAVTYTAGAMAAVSGLATPPAAVTCPAGHWQHGPEHRNQMDWMYTTQWHDHGRSQCMEKLHHPSNMHRAWAEISMRKHGDATCNLGPDCTAVVENVRPMQCRSAPEWLFATHEISDFWSDFVFCCPL